MRGEVLFEKMTHISDEYIAEAALDDAYGNPRCEKEENPFIRFVNSGWGVAMICVLVSLAAVIAMVQWGRMGDPVPPVGTIEPGSPDVRFTFSYEMTDPYENPITGAVSHGSTLHLDTTVVNQGAPFSYTGSSSGFCAYAQFVWRGDDSVTISGLIAHTTDIGTFTVETGEEGHGRYIFTIPDDAPAGAYDLVLSYAGGQKVFAKVLTVGEDESAPLPLDLPFSFGYELPGDAKAGETVEIPAWVINEGEAFSYVGDPYAFQPKATLVHMNNTNYRLTGFPPPTGVEPRPCTVETGAVGKAVYSFPIPEDAPTGAYGLVLSYGGATASFAGVLIVVENTPQDALTSPTLSADMEEFIIESYMETAPYLNREDVSVRYYYGQFSSGAIVAMIDSSDYTDALWEENVGIADLRYNDGNRIQVLYEGKFYSLPEAHALFDGKILTNADLATIENLQRRYCPYLYADPDDLLDGA